MEFKITTTDKDVVKEIHKLFGNVGQLTTAQACEYLGWHRNTLAKKVAQYGIKPSVDEPTFKQYDVIDIARLKIKIKRKELAISEGRIVN